jgi:hypothetical protein
MGSVEHEADLGGSSRLDICFKSTTLGAFIGDVRTVSDDGYDRENPQSQFAAHLSRIAGEMNTSGIQGGFSYRINGIHASVWHRRYKTRLKLPPAHALVPRIFKTPAFRTFLRDIRAEPGKERTVTIDNQETSVAVIFSPRGTFQFGSYLSYNQAHDFVHNVVWGALESKSDQIKRAGPRATGQLAGVFLCDGDCGLLRASSGPYSKTLTDVIREFLRKSSTVDFVCVVDIPDSVTYGQTRLPAIQARVWSKRDAMWAQKLADALNAAFEDLPVPDFSPVNTLNRFKWAQDREHLWGKYSNSAMTDDSLEISLRATMDYLAGRSNRTDFERTVHGHWLAELKNRLEQGKSIDSVSVERGDTEDDHRLVIKFGDHDPAISPFRVPSPNNQ